MTAKEFCQKAIENGYRKTNICTGWAWIKNNLAELDFIFQTAEYKAENGMRYKCMPLLIGQENLSEEEKDALGTAWYLQNDRQREVYRQEYRTKWLAEGWTLLTLDVFNEAIRQGKNLILKAAVTSDWLTSSVEGEYRPTIDPKGSPFLLAPRCRRKGYFLQTLTEYGKRDAFCKIL